jgi:hypothetical protein
MAKRHYEDRRKAQMEESMISEDRSAIANLPQNVMIKAYSKNDDYMPEDINDGISGIDRQIGADNSKRKAHNVPKKV